MLIEISAPLRIRLAITIFYTQKPAAASQIKSGKGGEICQHLSDADILNTHKPHNVEWKSNVQCQTHLSWWNVIIGSSTIHRAPDLIPSFLLLCKFHFAGTIRFYPSLWCKNIINSFNLCVTIYVLFVLHCTFLHVRLSR